MNDKAVVCRALRAAFPFTIPIFAGFWFLGLTYGVYMNVSGFSFWYPLLMAMTIFGGSLEFVAVSMLTAPFAPLRAMAMALVIQARHLFYGLAMLEKFKELGWKKPLLIFLMCDESFSINCAAAVPAGVDRGWFMLFVSLLNYAYWVSGSALGGALGSLVRFNTEGLEFVMTAMFVVIFTEQWLKEKSRLTALIGLASSALCLFCFGPDSFMIPSMLVIFALLALWRRPIIHRGGYEE